ncbi:RNA pyrophosphohydrolase [Methyloceanibacter sp.]|uniref:RNA pyrophosphohydrolase n=1 Tax=Methyloceanibacter sp. TaxID=1965321 RepID=UPI002D259E8E|nr:RNA pyrophosphohydrolase [Methyloceanibacter sp.]HZP08257.1 RNA pyrophosphohydrolase [Methyloceanibacter sp.]
MTDKDGLPYRPCVGIMLLNREGRAFVGRRAEGADAPEGEGQWWQMPQGGLDEGEDPEAAARRELFEETGVRSVSILARSKEWLLYDLPEELIGVAWEGRYRGQKQLWFAARFEGPESEINLSPAEGHEQEFDAWRWVRVEDLPSLIVPFKRAVYERVVEEFRPLIKP